jgi:uncharacterized protein with beta-barrel porin domain
MKLFRGGILFLAFANIALVAHGQTSYWLDNGTEDWNTSTNWSNGVPNGVGAYAVFLPGVQVSVASGGGLVGSAGSPTIVVTSSQSDTSNIYVLNDTTDYAGVSGVGSVSLDYGTNTLTVPSFIYIDGGDTLNFTGNMVNTGEFIVNDDFVSQNAQLNLLSGTVDNSNGIGMFIGQSASFGTVTQGSDSANTSSTVTTGTFVIVGEGGTGTYTLSNASILQTGTLGTEIIVGGGDGTHAGTGTLDINDSSQFIVGNGSQFIVGGNYIGTSGGTGNVLQSGSTSLVTLGGTSTAAFGDGGTGTYEIDNGTLTISNTSVDLGVGATDKGYLIQKGGTMTVANGTAFTIGDAGTGSFTMSGGSATFNDTPTLGNVANSSGTIAQSGGTLTTNNGLTIGSNGHGTYTLSGSGASAMLNGMLSLGSLSGSVGTFTQSGGTLVQTGATLIGDAGTGTMTLGGGTATFNGSVTLGNSGGTGGLNLSGSTVSLNNGLIVDATGTVTLSAGTATIAAAQTVDLAASTSTYALNGGTLNVSDDGIVANGINGAGTFNFGGGTLQAGTSNPLTDNLDGTVTGNSTLDATNNNITLGGNLTGSGGFTVIGGNNVNLTLSADATTAAAYTGATVIDGGNLVLNSPDGTDVFASAISGTSAGTLTINPTLPTATVRLPGTLDFLGTTTLNNTAYLNVYNGTLGNVAGTNGNLIVGQDGTQGTYGAGGAYTYPTTGTVSLTGTNSYTGSTQVYNGFTLYASNLATTTMTNNGTFGNNGTVGTNISIAGPYNQPQQATSAAEGTLLVRVAGNTADSFSATSATLYGTVGVSGYSAIGTTAYNIFNTAPAGLTTGTLNSATASGLASNVKDSTLLSAVLSFSPAAEVTTPTTGETNLYLIVTQLPFSQFALTPNQVAVANALDAALVSPSANDTLFAGLDSLSAAQIPDVLDQLSPRSYLYMRDLAFDNSTFLAENMHTRMESMREGFSGVDTSGLSIVAPGLESPLGRSLGSMLAYNGEGVAPNGVNYYPQDETAPPYAPPASSLTTPEESARTISDSPTGSMAPTSSMPSSSVFNAPNFSEFISGDLILADLKQDQSTNNIPEAHYTAADATAGIGFKITPHLVGGVLFDYNHTDARTDGQGSHVRVDTYSPGAFATVSAGGLYLDGLFTFGYNDYSNDRKINIGGTSTTATSSPSGEQYVGDVDLGYNFHPDHEGHWALGPEAGLEYVHLDVDSFTESGAGLADLSVNSQSADSLRGRLGGRLSYFTREGAIVFAPTVFASYQHEFLNDPFGLTSQFNIPSSTPFTIQGTNPGRDSALIGIGASATFDNAMSIYLNYLAEVGANDYFVQSVQGGLRASF